MEMLNIYKKISQLSHTLISSLQLWKPSQIDCLFQLLDALAPDFSQVKGSMRDISY